MPKMVPKVEAENDIVNAAFLGRVLGISRASIANLATDKILPRADRGLYDLPACVQAYIRHKLLQAGSADIGTKTLVSQRSRLATLKADQAEREAGIASGDLVPAGAIAAAWLAVTSIARMRILSVAKKIAPRVIVLKTATEAESLIQKEINAALASLAETPTVTR